METPQTTLNTHGLTGLGYLILMDRYALKKRGEANVGDLVIAILNNDAKDMGQKRELGFVTARNEDTVSVRLVTSEEIIDLPLALIEKPLETDPKEIMQRVARGIASAEIHHEKKIEWQQKFEWLLDDWKFIPGGRIMAAAGTDQQLTYFNCYVIKSPVDSRSGILKTLGEMTEIMSRGGGVGINISTLRPKNAPVKGVNGRSSGSVSWGGLYSFVTGLIEQGGCFAGDTRIATDKGLIKISELVSRIEQNEVFYAQTHQGMRKITDKFRNGIKPLLEIKTKRGFNIKVTPNHPMLYLQDGKIVDIRAEHMVNGDKVLLTNVISNDSYLIGDNVKFIDPILTLPSSKTQSVVYKTPETMNPDLAYFLGYSYGDGYVNTTSKAAYRKISLATSDDHPNIQERLIDIIQNEFGYKAIVAPRETEKCTNIKINSRYIVEWLKQNDILKEKANKIQVPEVIFKSDKESILAFIAGYFDADGSVTKGKKGIKFSSINIEFLTDIQRLLGYCGIMSQISSFERAEEKWQTMHELYIRGNIHKQRFNECIPSSKDTSVGIGKRDMSCMYPSEIIQDYPRKYSQTIWDSKSNLSANQLTKIAAKSQTYGNNIATMEINEMLNLTEDEIVSIIALNGQETYDITVDDNHYISSNNIYTHNSRRGALMLILNDWHPDLIRFINSKKVAGNITNANISVGISDTFMKAVEKDEMWKLRFPDTEHPSYASEWTGDLEEWISRGYSVIEYDELPAREIWDMITESAWASAEPGVWFRERANKMSNSHYYEQGKLVATNPCGEQNLSNYSICNLGALNLAKFVDSFQDGHGNVVNYEELALAVRYGVRFLDNVIDATPYFMDETETQAKNERRIGLGIMGLAEMLIQLGIRYGSKEGVEFTEELFRFIAQESYLASSKIAAEKGSFPYYEEEGFMGSGYMQHMLKNGSIEVANSILENGMRNVTVLTVAPTGSTGTMVNTSTGIEPYFSWVYFRQGRLGKHEEKVPVLQQWLTNNNLNDNDDYTLPPEFVTAMDLNPEEHVMMQAAAQVWVDSAISKTCNAPNDYTIEQTKALYQMLYDLGCKGGTIYRDGSRSEQVLTLKKDDKPQSNENIAEDYKHIHEGDKSIKSMFPSTIKVSEAINNTTLWEAVKQSKIVISYGDVWITEIFNIGETEYGTGGYSKSTGGFQRNQRIEPDAILNVMGAPQYWEAWDKIQEAVEIETNKIKSSQKGLVIEKRGAHLAGQTFKGVTPYGNVLITINEDMDANPFEVLIMIAKSGSDLAAQAESIGRLMSLSLQMQPVSENRLSALKELVKQIRGIGGSRQVGFGINRVTSFPDAVAKIIEDQYIKPHEIEMEAAGVSSNPVLVDDKGTPDVPVYSANGGFIDASTALIASSPSSEVMFPLNGVTVSSNGYSKEHSKDHGKEHNTEHSNGQNKAVSSIKLPFADICPECQNQALVRQGGCKKCETCGYSEC